MIGFIGGTQLPKGSPPMKKLLFVIATTLISISASAQSAFEGFYGQIATGYESNTASNLNTTGTSPQAPELSTLYSGANQTFGGAPLVLGLGYNFSVAPSWLLGIGADYSALSQKSSTFSQTYGEQLGLYSLDSFNGNQLTVSNRFNIFLTPGYAIDKDKLVYLKAGYSSVSLKEAFPNQFVNVYGRSKTIIASLSFSSQTQTLSGYIVGLGYKQIITGGLYGFAEANYMAYGQKTFTSSVTVSGETSNLSNSPNLSSYQALVGVGYKF